MADINIERLRRIMKDFYTLTHIRIALLDNDIKEKISYPEPPCALCAYIRKTPELDDKCRLCDDEAFRHCKTSSAPMIYTCHAGLLEVIIPIKTLDNVLCYVMFGQIVDSARAQEQREAVYKNLSQYNLDKTALRKAVQMIDCRSLEEIEASATILESLALYFLRNRIIMPNKVCFIESLNAYIDVHVRDQIMISDLCTHFFVSRTRLYELSNPYLDCSLANYIQRRRIQHASDMLQTTKKSIFEIASETGFSDYNYFRRVFKKIVGHSAREHRQNTADTDSAS